MVVLGRDERKALALVVVVYGVSFAAGVLRGAGLPAPSQPVPVALQPTALWVHNMITLAPLWAGVFSFGALTLMWLLLQGWAHGLLLGASGQPIAAVLGRIWPHSLFELAAMWIAATVGLVPGVALFWRNRVELAWRTWPAWAIVWAGLLAVAAWLEGGGR